MIGISIQVDCNNLPVKRDGKKGRQKRTRFWPGD